MIIRQVYRDRKRIKYIFRNRKVIWEPESDIPIEGNTPSILGIAVLGRTILGNTSTGLPKLDTPVIRLSTTPRLDAPIIWLHTGTEEPDVPDVPEIQKLSKPVIWLDDGSGEPVIPEVKKLATPVIGLYKGDEPWIPDEPEYNTTAILGKAILGHAILGSSGSTLPKLDAPNIYLSTSVYSKLDAPIIRVETGNSDIAKLGTPVIYLDVQDPAEPPVETQKLDAPVIHLYVEEPDIPDEPDVSKLTAPVIELVTEGEPVIPDEPDIKCLETPVIYLEVIGEPVEPDEPDVPVIEKLSAPIITLEVIADEPDEPILIKLDVPVIELVFEESDEPEVPDEPVVEKLTTPEIYLDTAHEHTIVIDEAVAPTCTNTGLTEGKHCSDCGETLIAQTVVPALGHVEEVVLGYPATSTEDGLTDGAKCSRCGEILVEQEIIPALGLPKLTAPEIRLETNKEELPKLGTPSIHLDLIHTHEYTSVTVEPTCTEQGYTTHSCECGESYTEYLDASHDWSEPYFSDEDFPVEGYGRKCNRCGKLEEMHLYGAQVDTPTIYLKHGIADKLTITLDGDILSWNAPDNPDVRVYYLTDNSDGRILINGKPLFCPVIDSTEVNLRRCFGTAQSLAGTYTIQVCYRIGSNDTDGVFSYWSDPITYEYDGTSNQ